MAFYLDSVSEGPNQLQCVNRFYNDGNVSALTFGVKTITLFRGIVSHYATGHTVQECWGSKTVEPTTQHQSLLSASYHVNHNPSYSMLSNLGVNIIIPYFCHPYSVKTEKTIVQNSIRINTINTFLCIHSAHTSHKCRTCYMKGSRSVHLHVTLLCGKG